MLLHAGFGGEEVLTELRKPDYGSGNRENHLLLHENQIFIRDYGLNRRKLVIAVLG